MAHRDFQKKANLSFYSILAIALAVMGILTWLSFSLYSKLYLLARPLWSKLEEVCSCANHLVFTNHPFIFSFLILISLGLVSFFGFIIFRAVKLKQFTNRFVAVSLKKKRPKISPKLARVIASIGLEKKVIEINEIHPIIYCFGAWQPKICIAGCLVKKLDIKELTAVLVHEKQHLNDKAPVKIFIIKVIDKSLFFIPGLKLLIKQYLALTEMTADDQAIEYFQDKAPLAGALCKVIKLEEQFVIKNKLALSFFSVINKERINKLINSKYSPKFKVISIRLGLAIMIILLMPFLVSIFFNNQSVGYNHLSSCKMVNPSSDSCQLSVASETCSMDYGLNTDLCI